MKKNYYDILEVKESSNFEDIKKSYKKLAKIYHPDINKNNEEIMKDINEAYDYFCNQEKYGIEKIKKTRTSKEVLDVKIEIPIKLSELITGIEKKVKYKIKKICSCYNNDENYQTCRKCSGTGFITTQHGILVCKIQCQECSGLGNIQKNKCEKCKGQRFVEEKRTIDFAVSDCHTGNQFKKTYSKQGHQSSENQDIFGNLFIDIKIKDKVFSKDTFDNIKSESLVPLVNALCGGEVEINTIHGIKKTTIQPFESTEQKLTLKGLGFWNKKENKFKDHFVILRIEIPKKISEKEKEIIKSLSIDKENYPEYFNQSK